ncbi:hypothetical protein F4811DRAFT_463137 [Daldinia bambusicola]|nr:hypothetical protein F4811DRAFT_463137 [Daldinia bambusicola]
MGNSRGNIPRFPSCIRYPSLLLLWTLLHVYVHATLASFLRSLVRPARYLERLLIANHPPVRNDKVTQIDLHDRWVRCRYFPEVEACCMKRRRTQGRRGGKIVGPR